MNTEFDDKTNKNPSESHERPEEEYQFLKEVHKRRKMTAREILTIILGVCVLAVLFGVIAGAVFGAVSAKYSESHPSPVRMGEDSEPFSTVQSESSEAVSVSADSIAAASPVSEFTDPETSEETAKEESLADFERLNAKMKEIGDEAMTSVVHVMGIRNTEDWLHNTDTSTVTNTGLIVADTGDRIMILTDNESIDGAQQIVVELPDGSIVAASFVKKDPITNLAVISVAESDLNATSGNSYTVADLGSFYSIRSGDSIIAIGSPLGYSGSVVYGEVTSTDNTVSVTDGEYNLITTNIQGISSGNGFLVNTGGQVIGMIAQKYATQNSSVITGIPVSLLKQLIEILCNGEAISYIGIHGQTVSETVSKSSGIPTGVYVTQVDTNSPALEAGLAAGDVITEMDGRDVDNMKSIHNKIASSSPGDTIPITVQRNGADGYVKFEFELKVGECK